MAPKGNAVTPVEGQTSAPRAFDRYKRALAGEAEMTAGEFDASEISASITDRMLVADTLEEAFEVQESGLLSGQDMVDIWISKTESQEQKCALNELALQNRRKSRAPVIVRLIVIFG